ncbi:cytochrome P450 [Mycobacterium decipiens]|uniref:Cytochrome n=1 Tax=Mycobacterium decipiens TaxID=1430326 RepID=A0A1X2LYG3_9MYCO|nr:cytochrome P450 [Mycobacterium decipiens]OSC42261.1 cytochrome [Mycobacterium decipiens]
MTATGEEVLAYPFGPVDGLEVDSALAEMCREQPVLRVRLPFGGDAWLVTRHADVKTVLSDPRFSRAAAVGEDVPRTIAAGLPSTSMLSMDPPQHSRLRRRVIRAFTVRRVESLRPRVQQIVDGLLDTMIAAGSPGDLAKALTWPLPITVVCELLGVPITDRDRFTVWVDDLLMLSDPEQATQAREHLNDYLAGQIARRRVAPTDDLLAALVTAPDDGDRLNDEDLIGIGVSLLSAGHEATANQLGNFVYTLLTNLELWRKLVAQPGLIPAAVEELSRTIPISASAGFTRIATADVELSGRTIRAGDAVVVEFSMANRDPEVFDHPEVIDFHRRSIPHLAFGYGVHHCLGAQLARMELRLTLESLIRRLPGLRLAVPAEQLSWRTDRLIRGLDALPVIW